MNRLNFKNTLKNTLLTYKIKSMKSIKEINTETKEGKYLLMALASLTVSPKVHVGGKTIDGRKTTPDDMLQMVGIVVDKVYNEPTQP
jgi:hypothetical protein